MKQNPEPQREFRVVAAGLFKATCLQLLDEVYENRNLSILVTKRGKLVGQLVGPPDGITLSGPAVQEETYNGMPVPLLQAKAANAAEEHRKKRKDKKKKRR